ncbi:MAG: DNA polymerase III subunit epsilon [Parvularculales bacterium]
MREIVLDTETTGLEVDEDHRIVEIGCIELINYVPTGEQYHTYVNPERAMPEVAWKVHGLDDTFLADQPVFTDIVEDFLSFIGEAPLVMHNAPFDMGFLNAELKRLDWPPFPEDRAIDTLEIARRKYPGRPNNLDALCRRFKIDLSGREKHSALLDAKLLAEVYLKLLGGREPDLGLVSMGASDGGMVDGGQNGGIATAACVARLHPLPPRLSDEDRKSHDIFVESLARDAADGIVPLWKRLSSDG